MKPLYESLLTGNVRKPSAKVQPSSREELQQLISEYIEEIKPHPGEEVNLNWIDISGVDNLYGLFKNTNYIPVIDEWKIDHVKDFTTMFAYNEYIEKSPIPVLQEKLKDNWCYCSMFEGCTSLEVAPELPAINLKRNCYRSMFKGCTSLEEPPELPAAKLKPYCYCSMFEGCTSLEVAPGLPAKKLEQWCYSNMFEGCTSLEVAPELPATKLEPSCYSYMFAGCTSLEVAPELPATKLEPSCYSYMFKGCPKIKI